MCASVPGTTRKHAPVASTALPKRHPTEKPIRFKILGQGFALSYLEHSRQTEAFESPVNKTGTGNHPGRLTPCAVSLTLRCNSHVGQDNDCPVHPGMCKTPVSPLFPVSLLKLISGGRIQKHPLIPPGLVFPDSAPSLLRLTGKGLRPFHR